MWSLEHILNGTDDPTAHLRRANTMNANQLLRLIADEYGFDAIEDMLQAAVFDSVSPGICLNCHETQDCEPDADRNWCENCGRNMVASVLVIANLI